ncbi:MAG: YfhO family protein [Bacteroidota bacterium]|nr:YfhO family protein [Bacteroidota bacterium]
MSKKVTKQNIPEKKKIVSEAREYSILNFNKNWLNLLILGFVWFILFRELLFGNAWLHDDFPYVYYPGKFLAAVSLADGIFPFWNPYSFSGMPFFADPQVAILYPFNFVLKYFVSDSYLSPLAVQNSIVIHYLLLSIFCYYLGKELKFNNFVSLVFSLMFTYSSYMIIHMMHMNLIETVVWLPLLMLLLLKFINRQKYIYIFLAGIVMSFSILAGYPQCFFYNFIFLSVILLYYIYKSIRSKDYKALRFVSAGLFIFFAVSICISLVQLLPTYVLSENSSRVDLGYEFAKQGSVHPLDIVTLFVPKVFGTFNWNESAGEVSYWSVKNAGGHQEGSYMYTISTLYLTLLPVLILIPVIRFSFKRKNLNFPVMLFLILSLVVLLFSLGGNFFVHQIFYYFIPFFNRFRNPGHINYLFSFCILLVTAFGLNEIIKNKGVFKKYFSKKYFVIVASVVVLVFLLTAAGFFKSASGPSASPEIYSWITKQVNIFVFLALIYLSLLYAYFNNKINTGAFQIIFLIVLFADIYLFAYNQNNGNQNPELMYKQNSNLINQIKEDQKDEQFRVNMRQGSNMLFQRYQGAVDKIQLIEGINVLNLNRVIPINKDGVSSQALDLLNVKYKINVDEKSKSKSLTTNPGYLPRAKMFYDVKIIEDENQLKDFMKSNDFDYNKTLVIEKAPPNMTLPDLSKSDSFPQVNSNAVISEYGMNKIRLDVETDENGFLFLSEIYYPDWKAYVDGKETEIYRADFSLRAIYLEKGKHSVELIYESNEFDLGAKISAAAFFLSLVFVGVFYFKDRKSSESSK